MPGPCNSKKKRKQQSANLKARQKAERALVSGSVSARVDASRGGEQYDERTEDGVAGLSIAQAGDRPVVNESRKEHESVLPRDLAEKGMAMASTASPVPTHTSPPRPVHDGSHTAPLALAPDLQAHAPSTTTSRRRAPAASPRCAQATALAHTGLAQPFIADPGNGPRVKDAGAFLASFFCPPTSREDETCAAFARAGVLDVLEAVLPQEIALIVWFNKTRKYRRICPACQRLYRLGDALADPISGESVDVYDTQTPPQVLREQQMSGICSSACFLLASYTSHPYVAEVARGAWGQLAHELSAQTRALLDTTDPATAALMRFGIDAWEVGAQDGDGDGDLGRGLGRAMRMTRRVDMGIGDVLQALAWAEAEAGGGRAVVAEADRRAVEGRGGDDVYAGGADRGMSESISAPVGIRA